MKLTRTLVVLALLAWRIVPVGLAQAQADDEVKTIFEHPIPNIEGKSMVAVVVTYPPGGKSLGPSPCPVGIHLRLRVVRRYSKPG